jgi:hypothetical protein
MSFTEKLKNKLNSGLKNTHEFSLKRLVIFIIIFGAIGAYLLFRSFAATPPANIAYGDLDGNNIVDDADKAILLSNFGTTSAAADINGSGKVDILDLSILLSHFGTNVPGAAVASVNLIASPTFVAPGGSSTLSWTSTDVTSCTASGGWSGTKPASNPGVSTGSLNALTTFTLNCTGPDGPASTTMTVRVENVSNGWWHTSGTQILDSSNHAFRPTSAFVTSLAPGSGTDIDHPDVCGKGYSVGDPIDVTRVLQSGLNTVFLNVSWANLEPTAPVKSGSTYTHTWNTAYLNTINSLVQQYTAQHVHVVLNMMQSGWSPGIRNLADCEEVGLPTWLYPPHGDPNELHNDSIARCHFFMDDQVPGIDASTIIAPQEGYVAATAKFADFFKTNDYVSAIDALSEPGWGPACTGTLAPPADALSAYYDKAGNALQAVNSHILMIFEDRIWNGLQKTGTEVPRKPNTTLANIVYGYEYYPDPPDHARFFPDFQDVLTRAHTDFGPALIIAFNAYEGGFNNASQQGDLTWQADTAAMLSYLKTNNTGWAFWALHPGAGASLEDKTTDHNLKLDLLSVLQGGF